MQKFSPEYFKFHQLDEDGWQQASNVEGADAATYRLLNHCWSVDKRYVYLTGRRLKHADPQTFAALNEQFARDRGKVYSKRGVAGCVVDVATFEVLDEGCYPDRWNAARYGGYARDRHAVYFVEGESSATRVVRGADPATFVSVRYLYGKDAKAVYYEGKAIAGSVPQQLEVLDELRARDGSSVFYAGRCIDGANPAAYVILDEYHSRDDRHVYNCGQVIPEADPDTYQQLDGIYLARDARQVFVSYQPQRHIDSGSFEFLGHDYFADKNGVYWQGKRIAGADRASFRVTAYGQAEDKRGKYWKEHRQQDVQSTGSRARRGGLSMFLMLIGHIFKTLWSVFVGMLRGSKDDRVSDAPDRPADMEVLAETLAAGDKEAFSIVALAIREPEQFVASYSGRESFVDEPDYASLFEDQDDPDDPQSPDPFRVLVTVYNARDLIGIIDWRSETQETVDQVEPMLRRYGIRDFDWSFIDALADAGDGSELRNNNFLTLLRDRLRSIGLTLAHVNLLGDSYGFAVLKQEDFARINGMQDPESFHISDDFGADDGYDRGRQLLTRLQPA